MPIGQILPSSPHLFVDPFKTELRQYTQIQCCLFVLAIISERQEEEGKILPRHNNNAKSQPSTSGFCCGDEKKMKHKQRTEYGSRYCLSLSFSAD